MRLGDSSMTPIPPMDRVIDYPYTRFKSELMDIYLISECRLFIGTNSGPSDVATLFKKPMLLVNATEWSIAFPLKKGDLAIIKHIFSRPRNRFLSVNEILGEPASCQFFGGMDEYVMFDNTAEEIRDVIEEFLAKPESFGYSQLQEAFNRGRRSQLHRFLDQEQPPPASPARKGELVWHYRVAPRGDFFAGTLGQKYLEQNWLIDNLEKSGVGPAIAATSR